MLAFQAMGPSIKVEEGKKVELLFQEKQAQMIRCGLMKGLHHPDTVRLSQELDRLLNEEMAVPAFRQRLHSEAESQRVDSKLDNERNHQS